MQTRLFRLLMFLVVAAALAFPFFLALEKIHKPDVFWHLATANGFSHTGRCRTPIHSRQLCTANRDGLGMAVSGGDPRDVRTGRVQRLGHCQSRGGYAGGAGAVRYKPAQRSEAIAGGAGGAGGVRRPCAIGSKCIPMC